MPGSWTPVEAGGRVAGWHAVCNQLQPQAWQQAEIFLQPTNKEP